MTGLYRDRPDTNTGRISNPLISLASDRWRVNREKNDLMHIEGNSKPLQSLPSDRSRAYKEKRATPIYTGRKTIQLIQLTKN